MALPLGAALGLGVGGIAADLFMSNRTNQANARLNQAQMDFQAMMSNTAHQREVKDLKAAGLNPILSATGGSGASTPGGASATMTAPDIGSSAKAMADHAYQYKSMNAQLQNTVADTASKLEQAKLLGSQNESTAKDIERKGIQNSFEFSLLEQQLKKSGLENEYTFKTLGDKVKQAQLKSVADATGIKTAEQALKYDYQTDKLLESTGMLPSSAKDNGAWSLHGAFLRRLLGK